MTNYLEIINDGKMLEIFASSYYQTMGYYVDANLKWIEDREDEKGKADILELDVLAKRYYSNTVQTILIECKRGCDFNDFFKFVGVAKLVDCDNNILLCQSHFYMDLKKIGEKLNIDVVLPEILFSNINNDELKLNFGIFMTVNDLCNNILDKNKIKTMMGLNYKFTPAESNAYNRIRAYMSKLIGEIWRETDYVKRVNSINELLNNNKDFVREIARSLKIKPGNKASEFYMNTHVLCQAAGYLVLKVKVSYIINAVECAIMFDEDLEVIHDEQLNIVVNKLRQNKNLAVMIPKFIQTLVYIFGGFYSELDNDLNNIAEYIQEPISDLKKCIDLLKELFTTEYFAIQWGFTYDMGVYALKFVPTPLKGIGIKNRTTLKYVTDSFCFADQWIKTTNEWGSNIL